VKNNASLERGLKLFAAISIVICTVIGTGIFLKARVMTCNVGSPGAVILVWIVAAICSLAGALTYAELGAMMPEAGGEYVFIREAYGPRWAFVYGWTQFSICYSASQAAKGVAFAVFLNVLTGGWLEQTFFSISVAGHTIPFGWMQIVALLIVAIITGINCFAVTVSGGVASFLTILKIALVAGIAFGGLVFAKGDWSHFHLTNIGGTCEGVSQSAMFGWGGFAAAMLGALWAYDGWSNLTILAGEVKDPQRNVPRALIGGMLAIAALYILVNTIYFYVLTPTEVASVPLTSSVATQVVLRFVGPMATAFMAAGLLISTVGSLHTGILTAARVPYAMARDRLFFHALAEVSRRTHVPVKALIVQAIWISFLVLSGSFDTLTDYVIFAAWIFYALNTASVFVFRKKMPDAARPYRTFGYPITPIIFLLAALWLTVSTLVTAPVRSVIGLAFIALGIPLYSYWNKRKGEKHVAT
jgi:basic amino acid/polyamine antiporter, APA family